VLIIRPDTSDRPANGADRSFDWKVATDRKGSVPAVLRLNPEQYGPEVKNGRLLEPGGYG